MNIVTFEDLVQLIQQKTRNRRRPLVIAIDGRSGVGKSQLATRLAELVDGVVVQTDDFYSGGSDTDWDRRSPAEKADLVIDWRRLRKEVVEPLVAGKAAFWKPFNFETGYGLANSSLSAVPTNVIILEGAYSARPELADLIDLSVLIVANDAERRARLIEREGSEYMQDWHRVWDVSEDHYFGGDPPNRIIRCGN